MNILYLSVHAILEYDEIKMLKALGHNVFPLGVYFGFTPCENFRDPLEFNEVEHELLRVFRATGCHYQYYGGGTDTIVLSAEFLSHFETVIVMHDLSFIEKFWPSISNKRVIWRTIGQDIDNYELRAAPLRAAGMDIVRYSSIEATSVNYCGQTAMIRFGKNPTDYGPWTGHDKSVLLFSNMFRQRFPKESAEFFQMVDGFSFKVGGVGNDDVPGNIGMLSEKAQIAAYNANRAYLYCTAPHVPYTLNFMEAMMTGIPIIATDFKPTQKYYEVPALLRGCGHVVESIEEARGVLKRLIEDDDFAADMSRKTRDHAVTLFSEDIISKQWEMVLS